MYRRYVQVNRFSRREITKTNQKAKNKISKEKFRRIIRFPDFYPAEVSDDEEPSTAKIVKTKNFNVKPMSEEEAVLQMELIGHSFFVFQDAETNHVNVVYKRKDGNYGLIEPEY